MIKIIVSNNKGDRLLYFLLSLIQYEKKSVLISFEINCLINFKVFFFFKLAQVLRSTKLIWFRTALNNDVYMYITFIFKSIYSKHLKDWFPW